MAANLAEFNNYLTDPIGISDVSIRTALNEQGLDGFDELVHLTEKDIVSICANARKPGGTIDNPNYDPQNPVPGVPARIVNPGVLIGTATEKRLKMLWYYVGYLNRVQRAFAARQATLNRLTTVYKLKEQHEEATSTEKEITMPEKLTSVDKV